MARSQPISGARKNGQQSLSCEKRPSGITKQQKGTAIRKSERLEDLQLSREQRVSKRQIVYQKEHFSSPSTSDPNSKEPFKDLLIAPEIPKICQKQQRSRELGPLYRTGKVDFRDLQTEHDRSRKQERVSSANTRTDRSPSNTSLSPIDRWVQDHTWPKQYFQIDNDMNPLLKKRILSLRDENTRTSGGSSREELSGESSSHGEVSREGKNPAARSLLYEKTLENAGIYMVDIEIATTDAGKELCKTMLAEEQQPPKVSLFQDDVFRFTCARVLRRNEAMVLRDITPLIVPSAEVLFSYGAKQLKHLIEEINVSWSKCLPLANGPIPQPDYSVGFKSTAFTGDQLQKLEPYISNWKNTHFMATEWMHFPFLTCEVKCGNEALNIADRQNAHSASVAVKGIVELYKALSRQNELHREILAFSISHDQETVRIYGHYPFIDGSQISFYRHSIHKFDFTALEGKEKWTAFKFTRNLYDVFAPIHLDRIRAAIDQLPCPEIRSHLSDLEFESQPDQDELAIATSQDSGPASQRSEPSAKKSKRKRF